MTRKAPLFMRRKGSSLVVSGAMDAEQITQYAEGVDLEVQVKQRRSGPQHRLYWAMLGNVVQATGGEPYPTADHLHEALKIALGYVRLVPSLTSDICRALPDSTAFEKMDQAQFKDYFDRAVALLAERFGIDPLELRRAA